MFDNNFYHSLSQVTKDGVMQPTSIIDEIFRGELCTRLQCTECQNFSGEKFH